MFAMTSSLGDKFGFENAKITNKKKSFNAFHLIKLYFTLYYCIFCFSDENICMTKISCPLDHC